MAVMTNVAEGPPSSSGAPNNPTISGQNITKSWGTHAVLTNCSFQISGGVTGLLGSNGAGKTTLFGMILGLHEPNSGELRVFGLDPRTAGPKIRARIGYSPEHHLLPPDLRAHDLVRHIGEIHGLSRRDATTRASDALWQVGLGEERFRALGTMSTGQRQRVKLAQALVHDPALILLDEPTDGLDPLQREKMLSLIRRIGTEFGIDVVLSSHLLEEVEQICDSVVILANGTVAASGGLGELRGDTYGVVAVLDRDVELVGHLLSQAGWSTNIAGNRLSIAINQNLDQGLDALRDAIAEVGAPLRSLQPERRSLEDIFLGSAS